MNFFYSSASGWIATILIGVEILLPYLLRRSPLSQLLSIFAGHAQPYLQRMWPHYWVGYLLLSLSLAHGWTAMSAGQMRRTNATGLWIATLALCILLSQALLGLLLQDKRLEARTRVRRWHFWMMLALGFTVTIHIWLNS